MPPRSERQKRYIFAQANKGVPWAKRYVAEAPTMSPRKSAMKRMIRKKGR